MSPEESQLPKKPQPLKTNQMLQMLVPILVVTMLLSLVFISLNGDDDEDTEKLKYNSTEAYTPEQKSGEMRFNVTIDAAQPGDETRLWLPYPMSNDYQTVENVTVVGNYQHSGIYRDSASGNVMLYAQWSNPAQTPHLEYSFDITRTEIYRKDFTITDAPLPPEMDQYLRASSLGPISGEVKEIALKATAGKNSILTKAIGIYDYIVENAERDPTITGCGDGDVCELLDNDISGKCTDIHSVFVAMARSVGIPAREVFGTRIAKEGDITGAYHCRAEFYLPDYGWVPVDPSDVRKAMLVEGLTLEDQRTEDLRDYYFGAQTETYIDFYSGRDITLNPQQEGEPLNYLMYPYAEVDGVALDYLSHEELQYQVSFTEQG